MLTVIEDLPCSPDDIHTLSLCTSKTSAFVHTSRYIACVDLISAKVVWLVERPPVALDESVVRIPRYISLSGTDIRVDEQTGVVVELLPTACRGLTVSARQAQTGAFLWEQFVPIPEAAEWVEPSPHTPGAQTEKIYAFIAKDPQRLVVCLARHSRRALSGQNAGLPQFASQLDAARYHVETGERLWQRQFPNVHVGVVERQCFTGLWACCTRFGLIKFETGDSNILLETPHNFGRPVIDGSALAVPWHSTSEIGMEWVDPNGQHLRRGSWQCSRVNRTEIHATEAGLALQTNSQRLWWMGTGIEPLWSIRAEPYIYRVHRLAGSPVFVGTDGNGGRLLGFDASSGSEVLNLKPVHCGVGWLTKIPAHDLLVSTFRVSRSWSVQARLLVFSPRDLSQDISHECFLLMATWEHGAVCRVGREGEQLAVIDIRSPGIA